VSLAGDAVTHYPARSFRLRSPPRRQSRGVGLFRCQPSPCPSPAAPTLVRRVHCGALVRPPRRGGQQERRLAKGPPPATGVRRHPRARPPLTIRWAPGAALSSRGWTPLNAVPPPLPGSPLV
jgi:hypothetical protein